MLKELLQMDVRMNLLAFSCFGSLFPSATSSRSLLFRGSSPVSRCCISLSLSTRPTIPSTDGLSPVCATLSSNLSRPVQALGRSGWEENRGEERLEVVEEIEERLGVVEEVEERLGVVEEVEERLGVVEEVEERLGVVEEVEKRLGVVEEVEERRNAEGRVERAERYERVEMEERVEVDDEITEERVEVDDGTGIAEEGDRLVRSKGKRSGRAEEILIALLSGILSKVSPGKGGKGGRKCVSGRDLRALISSSMAQISCTVGFIAGTIFSLSPLHSGKKMK